MILIRVLERLREKYSGAKPIDVEIVTDGKFNGRGREWWAQLSGCTRDDFKAWNAYLGNRLPIGKYFPNVIELHSQILTARDIGRTDGIVADESKQLPPPDIGSSSGWRERVVAAERRKHPEWENQPSESSNAYAVRMLAVMRGLAEEFDRKRIVTPQKPSKGTDPGYQWAEPPPIDYAQLGGTK